jgi:hypothetical protein
MYITGHLQNVLNAKKRMFLILLIVILNVDIQ